MSLLDKLVMHDRDLPRRATEADEPKLQPEPKCLTLGRWCDRSLRAGHRRPLRSHGGEA
jgi:hypothetical protein